MSQNICTNEKILYYCLGKHYWLSNSQGNRVFNPQFFFHIFFLIKNGKMQKWILSKKYYVAKKKKNYE